VRQAALLKKALGDVDLAYQNLESVELGVTTVDHYFDTLGGIARAVKRARGGEEARVYISDTTRGAGKVRTLKDQVALETRSRSLNPKWFEGQLKHGHEGVRQIEAQITNTMGWSATTGAVDPWVYQRISETFVLDAEMRKRWRSSTRRPARAWRTACWKRMTATTGSPTRRRSKRCRMRRTKSKTGWKALRPSSRAEERQ
jgi:magnesium chelatase subunit H